VRQREWPTQILIERCQLYGWRRPDVTVLSSASANKPIEKLSTFMTAPDASALEARLGHYYEADGPYLVGREKVREYARAVQDYHPAHWDVEAAAKLGYSGLVAPLTFTSTPAMACNRRMFESVVVGYDTYLQTEEVFEQHRPIVAGDELKIDIELTAVRRIAGRDLITVTNTFTDTAGERVHTLHTTVVGVTADDINPATMTAVQNAMMHDVDFSGIGASDADYQKTVRPEGEARISEEGLTRTPGTPSFDDLKVGDQLGVHHTRLSRGDLVNYAGVAGDANPIHWDEDIAKLAGLPDVIAHGMLTMGLGAGFVSAWSGDPGAVTRYAVRLSQPAIVSAKEGCDIEFSGKIKSLDPEPRTGVVLVAAKSEGKKIFGLATLNICFS
jgi:acyl dehydratase